MGDTTSSFSATHPAVSRILALLTYNRLVSAEATASTINAWRALGSSLDRLANDLRRCDDDRSEWFRALSNTSYRNAAEVQRMVHGRRPGRGAPQARRAERGWQPANVIEVVA